MASCRAATPEPVRAVDWRDGAVVLIDQRRLPGEEVYVQLRDAAEVAGAIRAMVVRGAPAIGIAAAYGVVLASREAYRRERKRWHVEIEADLERLAQARPTAVNLAWALARMRSVFDRVQGDPEPVLLAEARAIHEEDIAANRRMGEIGAAYLPSGATVLTHCNAGALATGGYGTALGVIRTAHARGLLKAVYATETRPWLQGSRLTAWELTRDGISTTLIADSAAAHLMKVHGVDWVVVGADRIAASGDVANKIGTYTLALAARAHGAKFMVVAPVSTFDTSTASGAAIPIELRTVEELLTVGDKQLATANVGAWNPVFDITPASLIDVIVTERGAIERPNASGISVLLKS